MSHEPDFAHFSFGTQVRKSPYSDAILCDVSVGRQVEIKGPDAAKSTQYLTCRDLSKCAVGQCKYVLITDRDGGIINDPILLKLAEDHFWLSAN